MWTPLYRAERAVVRGFESCAGRRRIVSDRTELIIMSKTERFVVVTTRSRRWRIEAGILVEEGPDHVVLRDARCILYYSSDARGPGGIAVNGPGSAGRVGPRVARATICGVESIHDCTAAARAAIEAEPWH